MNIGEINFNIKKANFITEDICKGLTDIAKILRLRKPGKVFLKLVSSGESGMLKFVLVLPEKSASDVVSRKVSIQVGTGEVLSVDLEGDVLETAEFTGNDNDPVTGSLVDVDDAGNNSEPRDFNFVLVDTIPPPLPGEVGLRVTAEV